MAARFWVGGTGTWDAADTTHWAASSGGAGGASVPGAGDDATFDANSSGGTVTVNFGGTISLTNLTFGAFGGTLDFSANNNSITLSGNVNGSGTGTRTFNMGNGTWTLTANSASWTFTTVTNLTFNANSSTIAFTGSNATGRTFAGGGLTYNIVTVSAIGTGIGSWSITGANTISTLTISAPNRISVPNGVTQTVTTLTNVAGSSSQQVLFQGNLSFGVGTFSSANNWTGDWCGFAGMTFSGGGTFTATNSFNFGGNTGVTITAPSGGGGGGGQRVISG